MPIPRVLAGITVEPGRPRLTWYDTDERVELSGHVLDNWVMKAANLLVEEYQAGPGTCVLIDLPVHWRAVIWAMATWRVGGCVVLPGEEHTGCDVVITDRPEGYRGTELVAVALPVMARQFDGELPPGALDAAEAVMTYGDVLTWIPEPDPQAPALVAGGQVVLHAGLLDWAAEAGGASGRADGHDDGHDDGAAPRVLLEPGPDGDASRGVARMLARLLSIYVADGSAVLCSAAEAEALAEDPARRQRLIETELVTASGG